MLLFKQTSMLIDECENCLTRFWKMREEDRAPDFYAEVKPHADEVHALLNEWKKLANEWITNNRPKYMHMQQIASAAESMEQFVVQSFFKETSKKRFVDSIRSTSYTLKTFLRLIEEENGRAIEEKINQ